MSKELKVIRLREDVFNKILEVYSSRVQIVPDIHNYYMGAKNKQPVYYNGSNILVCREHIVDYFTDSLNSDTTLWKQVRVIKELNMEDIRSDGVDGQKAKQYMYKLLYKYYTKTEIEQRFEMFQAEYDPGLKQISYSYPADEGIVYKISNTYKYDINGAHLDALCEIFPKAEKDFINMYEKRKQNPILKQYANLFVGTLAQKTDKMRAEGRKGKHEKTYNWIVQRTTKKILECINQVQGELIYVKTDGFIVKDPKNILEHSTELGGFKLEYSGDTYIYRDRNYILYQTDKIFGTSFQEIRDDVDLSKGQVVHYTEYRENHERKPINKVKEILPIYEA